MTTTTSPIALLLAAVMFVTLWVPTLTAPGERTVLLATLA
jgi:hypothetical protein